MSLRYLPLLLLALSGLAGCTQPRGMYQEAGIHVDHAKPCFMIADTAEARANPPALVSVSVDRYVDESWENLWEWIAPTDPRVHIKPGQCAPTGATMPLTEVSPYQLQTGQKYQLVISAQIPNPTAGGDVNLGRIYSQEFCLKEMARGKVEAVNVPRVRGVTRWEVCAH